MNFERFVPLNASKPTSLSFRDHLTAKDGHLLVDGVSCGALAEKFGTPLYVLSENRIRHNYRGFHGALEEIYHNVLVCPAYKANSHLAVCRLYQTEGAGAEVVSTSELRMALDAGVDPERIVYNGPLKKKADLEFAISSDTGLINADSVAELEHMQQVAHRISKKCNVGLRINIGIRTETHPHLATALREHKFGIWIGDAIAAYKVAAKKSELNTIGMHCHIGSNISERKVLSEMSKEVLGLAAEVERAVGLRISKIDLGGGLGFPYQPGSPAMTYGEYASSILTNNIAGLKELHNPTVIFEPGRAIVADSGILLTTVNVVKRQGGVNWAIVDAGMNTFIRPALYEAKHQVILASRASDERETYSVGGPCCESADVIAKNILLPPIREHDLLAVLDVGAYGFTMSNNYNGQLRPAVALVSKGEGLLIRRRESYEDMIAAEMIPSHLAKEHQSK
jgi:diaminopimelate decarboxylase